MADLIGVSLDNDAPCVREIAISDKQPPVPKVGGGDPPRLTKVLHRDYWAEQNWAKVQMQQNTRWIWGKDYPKDDDFTWTNGFKPVRRIPLIPRRNYDSTGGPHD